MVKKEFPFVESAEEKNLRHQRKEENIRLSLKGNQMLREVKLGEAIRGFANDHSLKGYELQIERLFAFPENYVGCERQYHNLFDRIKSSGNENLIRQSEKFQMLLRKEGLKKTAYEIFMGKTKN